MKLKVLLPLLLVFFILFSCSYNELPITLPCAADVSYLNDIKPILVTNCVLSTCHNGDNGPDIRWFVIGDIQSHAQTIKIKTGDRSMPKGGGSLTQAQIDLIACWVDNGAKDN